MFDFFKKLFGGQECSDCQNPENMTTTTDISTFPVEEVSETPVTNEPSPEVIEQPSLKMNMPTIENPTVETPVETQTIETPEIVETQAPETLSEESEITTV